MKLNSIFFAAALACGVLARPFSDIKYYTRDLDFGEIGARELYDINYPREFYEELYARKKTVSLLRLCVLCAWLTPCYPGGRKGGQKGQENRKNARQGGGMGR